MDAGFYRGTSAEQDIRFTDKERKLLKQMKFEQVLEIKVDRSKINLDVIKPWITLKLNEILGMEDDVVVEYVFTQLEEKDLNPKKIQINLTGFLNARRSREFMGELWALFVEAQNSPEGIPESLVEKKVQELKASSTIKLPEQTYAKATEIDWQHRYKALTGGRYGKIEPKYEVKVEQREENDGSIERKRRDPDDERDERAERRMRYEEHRFKERKDLLEEKKRREERGRRRDRSPASSPSPQPPVRHFSEKSKNSGERSGEKQKSGGSSRTRDREERKNGEMDDKERKRKGKKEKSRKRHLSEGSNDSARNEVSHIKKSKKHHKKDKKSKKHKERD